MIAIFPEIAACAARADIETLAILARRYFGGPKGKNPRLGVAALLRDAGIRVVTLPERRDSLTEGSTLCALAARDEGGSFSMVIAISPRVDVENHNFYLAHALGHVLLDIEPMIARGEWSASGFRETVCPLRRYAQGRPGTTHTAGELEGRADAFAGALLMPKGMVKRAWTQSPQVDVLARLFGVPLPCLTRRLRDLSLIEAKPSSFLEAEGLMIPQVPASPCIDARPISHAHSTDPLPRAVATLAYDKVERARAPAEPPSPPIPGAAAPRTGMDRLRELAHHLDQTRKREDNGR